MTDPEEIERQTAPCREMTEEEIRLQREYYAELDATVELENWLKASFISGHDISFESQGPKFVLHRIDWSGPAVGMLLDPALLPSPGWPLVSGKNYVESFFEKLDPVVDSWGGAKPFALSRNRETLEPGFWVPMKEDRKWDESFLELLDPDNRSEEMIIAGGIVGRKVGLIVFTYTLLEGLEIAYYGPDHLLREILSALEMQEATVATGYRESHETLLPILPKKHRRGDPWAGTELISDFYFHFHKLGDETELHVMMWPGLTFSYFVDIPVPVTPPWRKLEGRSYADSFFELLKPVVEPLGGTFFQGRWAMNDYTNIRYVWPWAPEWCHAGLLSLFDREHQDGSRWLGLIIGESEGLIFFYHGIFGLTISFKGPEKLRDEVLDALGMTVPEGGITC